MEKNSIRWEILLKGARGTLSPEEEIIFQKWLARDIRHKAYYEKMCRVWSSDNTTYDLHTDVAEMIVRFDDYVRNKRKVRRRKILRNVYRSVACLLILLTVGGGIMLLKRDKREMETANRIAGSILPGQGKAIILLPNGEKVDIASLSDSLSYRTAGFTVEKRFRNNQIYETTASPDRLSHDRYTDRRRISGEAERRDDGMVKFRFAVENSDGLCGKRKKSFFIGRSLFRCSEK